MPNPVARLIVVRDSRVPITPKATKTRQALDELQRAEVVVRHPSPEVLAALDALRSLLSDAKSGDLGYPSTVECSDGTMVTVWYEVLNGSPLAQLRQARWKWL